jgi:hypothetical protein
LSQNQQRGCEAQLDDRLRLLHGISSSLASTYGSLDINLDEPGGHELQRSVLDGSKDFDAVPPQFQLLLDGVHERSLPPSRSRRPSTRPGAVAVRGKSLAGGEDGGVLQRAGADLANGFESGVANSFDMQNSANLRSTSIQVARRELFSGKFDRGSRVSASSRSNSPSTPAANKYLSAKNGAVLSHERRMATARELRQSRSLRLVLMFDSL